MKRSRRLSIADGMLHAVMLGVSESFLGALAVELGHHDAALALLTTLPLLTGALAQGLTGALVRWAGSRKRLVVLGASIQAVMHLAFIAIAWFEVRSFLAFLIAKIAFWVAGMAIAPAWGAWMAALTRDVDRPRFFALRSTLVYAALLPAFMLAGLALERAQDMKRVLPSFVVLFGVGCVARLLSAYALARKHDAQDPRQVARPLWPRMREAALATRWRVPITLALFMLGAHIAMPFFTPYMLRSLMFGYDRYAMLTGIALLAKAATFPLVRMLAARIGLASSLFVSGTGAALMAYLWGHATSFQALVVAQVVDGAAWSGVELASLQLLLQSTREEYHVELLGMSACLSGIMQLAGSLIGSALLRGGWLHTDVFILSGVARALPLLLLWPLVGPAELRSFRWYRLFLRTLSIRPVGGAVQIPITRGRLVTLRLPMVSRLKQPDLAERSPVD